MIKIRLGRDITECPKWWENFLAYVNRDIYLDNSEEARFERVSNDLIPFLAKVYYEKRVAYIEFDSEKHYNMFLLKFS